jgi:hypothetical protein
MGRAIVRPATKADFDLLTDGPRPFRVRAFTGEVDGRPVAIGGIAYLENDVFGAFLHATDEARKYPVTLHKAGLMILREARALGIKRMVAMADPSVDAAERWLARLWFAPEVVGNTTVWVWKA